MAVTVELRQKKGDFQLDLAIRTEARRIGILGASGGGKSMTLKCIAGIETPDEGRILVDGHCFFDSEKKINQKPQKRKVGYLFQNYALFPTMTVEKNIAAGLSGTRVEKQKRVEKMIKKFRLEGLEKRLPGELSGGQQQRTALARIMAYEPEVILLDEPFSALDLYLKDKLQKDLAEMLAEYRGTVILVSHSRDEVYRFSEELFIIDQGKLVAGGETKKIFENPGHIQAARLTGCKNFSRARRIDGHTVEITDWKVILHTKQEVPEETQYIGYRAHDFIPVWKCEQESEQNKDGMETERGSERIVLPEYSESENGLMCSNMIHFKVESSALLPFEHNYYIRTPGENPVEDVICWFVQREGIKEIEKKGLPDYLALKEEAVLYLK